LTPEAHLFAHHAAFISLALNMQLLFLNSRFDPACFGQGKRRAARHLLLFPVTYCGVVPWFTDYITPPANTPSRHVLSDNICIARSLPGNRRARSGFLGHSSAISGGLTILFPIGLIHVCRRVPEPWLVPSGRSYIKWRFPTLPGSIRCRSSENKFYVISFLSLQVWALWIICWWLF
jgi:hypothetical protein